MGFSKKSYFLCSIFIFLFIMGCVDRKEQWIENYAQTKCAYLNEQRATHDDSIKLIAPLMLERDELAHQLDAVSEPYNRKIELLNAEIRGVQSLYMKQYRKVTDDHNAKYGHVSTPEYDKTVADLKLNRDRSTLIFQDKIDALGDELSASNEYQSIIDKMRKLDENIGQLDSAINANHQPAFDSLQLILDVQNRDYNEIQAELSGEEKNKFELKRDSIRSHPCE